MALAPAVRQRSPLNDVAKCGEEKGPHMVTLGKKLIRRLGDKPARFAFNVTNLAPIRRRLGERYDAAVAAHRPALPQLTAADQSIVDALAQTGIYATTLDALGIPGSGAMLEAAQRVSADCREMALRQSQAGRDFIVAPPDAILANKEIFHWGVNDRLLDIAEAYIGLPVAYDGLALIYTLADGREVATREWHRDREDRKMIKIAVYCNDVTPGGGPLQVISRVDPGQNDALGYRYAGGSEAELTSRLGADYRDDIVTCTGAAGTVVFMDAARYFHRGEPAYTEDRKALYYSYFARQTRHPFFCQRSGFDRVQLAQMAKGAAPRQRDAILWANSVAPLARLVPPAPV